MKKTEQMTIEEVTKKLAELREQLRGIHFGATGSKAKNVKEHGNIRREVARMETLKSAMTKS